MIKAKAVEDNGGGNLADQSSNDTFSVSRAGGYAAAHQYGGGVGVFASAVSRGINMQAQATAHSITSFTVNCPLEDLDGLVCGLDFTMLVSGSTAVGHQRVDSQSLLYSSAEAGYTMSWAVSAPGLNATGGGEVHKYADGSDSHYTTESGEPFSSHRVLYVDNGARVTISLQASAGAFTDNLGDAGAHATADFEHTLRWGGIRSAFSAAGRPLDLGQVHLLGEDGYDYVHAAPPNPYVSQVPEPANALLMALGLAAVLARGRLARRGRPASASAA